MLAFSNLAEGTSMLASPRATQKIGALRSHLTVLSCFSPSGFPIPLIATSSSEGVFIMWFYLPHQGLARHTRFMIGSLVLLSVWIAFSLTLMLPVSAYAAQHSSISAPLGDPQELETFLHGVLTKQMAAHHIPGAAVSVVKDGHILLSKGYGYADLQQGKKVQADSTLFRLGSVSNLLTWTALM